MIGVSRRHGPYGKLLPSNEANKKLSMYRVRRSSAPTSRDCCRIRLLNNYFVASAGGSPS
ncbi:hypothetical protein RSAG8_06231, partial [Rhizoctonia solani AG-8 WAC10335]